MINKLCIIIICASIFFPSLIAQSSQPIMEKQNDDSTISLVLGTIINLKEKNENVSGNALYVFYYTPGIRSIEGGIVKGLQKIKFESTFLFLVYQPGPFGQISYIYGFVKDFTIVE